MIPYLPGDPVPMFICASSNNPNYHFHSNAGQYVVLTFFGSANAPEGKRILEATLAQRAYYDDQKCTFFGVSCDPSDLHEKRAVADLPGIRYFWDFEQTVSRGYGAIEEKDGQHIYTTCTLVLDPTLRVYAKIPYENEEQYASRLKEALASLPSVDDHAGAPIHAPVLIVPRVFEPELCKELIAIYERHGGEESGFMKEIGGKTVGIVDPKFKKRRDVFVEDDALKKHIVGLLGRRLRPEIRRAFNFDVTHLERYIVACYDSESSGFFSRHRDNTTKGTAHRRFAVTINLNTEEFEGGDLRFPEFGSRTYRAPTGGAVVFGCGLLHEALPVTKGKRYAFLPFLYDEAAAKIRQQNLGYLADAPDAMAKAGKA
ncbi:MAG: 2OG-Fe(II) oxygenase [Alphaproteobacteria bacterium]|nr:2OG-Fe(II) oxygenase [Alphaproteobacteria bacterium]